jgi:hypothetical protein
LPSLLTPICLRLGNVRVRKPVPEKPRPGRRPVNAAPQHAGVREAENWVI